MGRTNYVVSPFKLKKRLFPPSFPRTSSSPWSVPTGSGPDGRPTATGATRSRPPDDTSRTRARDPPTPPPRLPCPPVPNLGGLEGRGGASRRGRREVASEEIKGTGSGVDTRDSEVPLTPRDRPASGPVPEGTPTTGRKVRQEGRSRIEDLKSLPKFNRKEVSEGVRMCVCK